MDFFFPAPAISVQITTSGTQMLGQSGYSLTCGVTGVENLNPSITYQWTKNNGTQTQDRDEYDTFLTFSPLRLSDAGRYTCQAMIISPFLKNYMVIMDTEDVMLQSELSCILRLSIVLYMNRSLI